MGDEAKQQPLLLYFALFAFLAYILVNRTNLYLARRRMIKENGCKPCPHVFHKDPIFGLDVLRLNLVNSKKRRILKANLERFDRFKSNTYHSKIMGMPMIITIEPENIKTLLSLKFKDYSFGARYEAFYPLLGDGIFNSDGERWANSRHLLRPSFVREQVADLDSFERHMKLLLKAIPRDGSTIDLQPLFFRLTIDTATEFLFNHSTNSLRMVGQDEENNEDAIFARAFSYAQDDTMTKVRLGFLDRLRKNTKGKDAIRICHAYVDKWVDDAVRWREENDAEKAAGRENEEERYIFIHELAKQTNDKKMIRDELMNILLAGRDTTAGLLSNMFFEIAKQPHVWARIREEIASLDGRMPTYEELRNLKYVKWCLNECKSTFSS